MLQYNGIDILFVEDVQDPYFIAINLMDSSPLHHQWRVSDLVHTLLPPIELKQIVFFRIDGEFIGMLTWAFFAKEVAYAFDNRKRALDRRDWKSGDEPWFIDFIAPNGRVIQIARAIKKTVIVKYPNYDKARAMRFFMGQLGDRRSNWQK